MERLRKTILNAPLFYKALAANSLIILAGGAVAITLARHYIEPNAMEQATVYIAAAMSLSLFANYLVLRVAFIPLEDLFNTVDSFLKGNLSARAQQSVIGAPQVNDLAEILNIILDKLQDYTAMIDAKNEQLQRLSAQVITAQEEERKRLARELHDETGQTLTSLMLGFKMLETAKDLEEVRERATELKALTGRTLDEVRKLAWELRPSSLDDLGLVPALRGYVKDFERKMPASIRFKAAGLKDRLPPEVETVLYRAVQEALTNVARHAQAGAVNVSLVQNGSTISAVIEDDGAGFDVSAVLKGKDGRSGLGLFGMRERASLVGGKVDLHSAPGAGTTVVVTIPIPPGGEYIGED